MSGVAAAAGAAGCASAGGRAYDDVPYVSHPFAETQPERLAAVAALMGHAAPPVATARVLELGMAGGGNLIPLAARYPGARFTGIDLSAVQVDHARRVIAAAGLGNIDVRQQDLAALAQQPDADGDGAFDYIVCHGVYSWVPPAVQGAILDLCAARLSPDGIAYVSYNVLPGWRQLQMVRDSLLILVDGAAPADRPRRAREVLGRIAAETPAGPYGEVFRAQATALMAYADDYIAHEHLESDNDPCTFTAFNRAAEARGLGYLGEADLASMLPEAWVGARAAALRDLGANRLVDTEQAIDIVTGRTFRRTLLVRGDRAARLDRHVTPARLAGLHVVAPFDLARAADAGARAVFTRPSGATLTTSSPTVAAACDRLIARLPASSVAADLLPAAAPAAALDEVGDALFTLLTSGMVAVSTEPVAATADPGERPVALASARADAALGATSTASLRHEPVALGIVAQHLLPLCDGSHDRAAAVAAVAAAARAGSIRFLRGTDDVPADAVDACAGEHVAAVIAACARAGLFTA